MRFQQASVLALALFTVACTRQEKEANDSRFSGPLFSEHVRSTEARSPEEERLGFKLPPGFEIQLYASEPDIGKPMNIAFDARGRMWVTQSFEYPFPAKGRGKDRISVLEDTNGDGKADKFTHFNDTMNIPIGILPAAGGVIAYSIPNVYHFGERGEGKAGGQKVLLGPFEHKDTHGMVNNLTWGFDGWVHADHGFTNVSTIAGKDGDSITMSSGNTFRFRPDGSRVEQTTFGRVNPFGLAFDELGYLYSVDCHSSPIYQLIRGADYPHFGKREEGIGFAPDAKPHGEESTALAGLAYYSDIQFPEEFRRNLFVGDVVTCRIHRYSFEFNGSSPVAKAEPDLVMSEDPWFRPVDVKLGPDGALYIADFYNRIIGHYEVPLDHPARDRIRGRIWRITYKGQAREVRDWTQADVEALLQGFGEENLEVRLRIANELVERVGKKAAAPLKALLQDEQGSAREYVHALWVLFRLDELGKEQLRAAALHEDPMIRIHAMRILGEMDEPGKDFCPLLIKALDDPDPHVQRAAAEALVKYPSSETIEYLLALRKRIPDYDSHLQYTARLALRNLLRDPGLLQNVIAAEWDDQEAALLADVMTGIELPGAGSYLFTYMQESTISNEQLPSFLQHTARFLPEQQQRELVIYARRQYAANPDVAVPAVRALGQGFSQRGGKGGDLLASWEKELADRILRKYFGASAGERKGKYSAHESSQQQFAAELAGKYKLVSLRDPLKAALADAKAERNVRIAAARALMQIDAEGNAALLGEQMNMPSIELDTRRQLAMVLGEFPGKASKEILGTAGQAPPGLQVEQVKALAGFPGGTDLVLDKVESGDFVGRTLTDPQVKKLILEGATPKQRQRYERLVAEIPPVSEEKQALIWERMSSFNQAARNDTMVSAGQKLFVQHCSPCHQIGGQGGMIGPQLNGIGNWGAGALAEKILDPNRNVSEAFRNYVITTRDGRTLTGLLRRDEGATRIFADVTGQEFAVLKSEIVSQEASGQTLMPGNFGETLSQDEFNKLLLYLLSQQ